MSNNNYPCEVSQPFDECDSKIILTSGAMARAKWRWVRSKWRRSGSLGISPWVRDCQGKLINWMVQDAFIIYSSISHQHSLRKYFPKQNISKIEDLEVWNFKNPGSLTSAQRGVGTRFILCPLVHLSVEVGRMGYREISYKILFGLHYSEYSESVITRSMALGEHSTPKLLNKKMLQ